MYPADEPAVVDRAARLRHHRLPLHPGAHSHLLRSYQVLLVLVLSKLFITLLRFGSGLSYSIVYSTLLVKLIFLICLNSGIYLTAAYQAVLLFFAILIQLAIGELFSISPLMFNHLLGGFDFHNQTLPHLIFDHSNPCLFQTLKPGHR